MPPTILCADDDRTFCEILARAFQREGYRVETVHDGESALQKIDELHPALVTLDVMLPRRDGFEVVEALRRRDGNDRTKVILFSACTFTQAYKDRARALHVDAMLNKPVPLGELMSVVSSRLQRPAVAAESDAAMRSGSEFESGLQTDRNGPMKGNLASVPFPALLHHLHGLRASGVLELSDAQKRKWIQLREGHPTAVRSNLVGETLGHLLVSSGKLEWDAVHESIRRVKKGEGLQGQILKAMHMLDDEDLANALRNQAEEKLFETFAWTNGRFRFRPRRRVRGANALALRGSAGSLILRGIESRTSIAQIDHYLKRRATLTPVPSEAPFHRFQDLQLDEAANAVLSRLDGRAPIAALFPLPEAERRALMGLIVIEILELRADRRRRAPSARRGLREVRRKVEDGTQRAHREEDGLRQRLLEMAKAMKGQDHFQILGVERQAGDVAIRAAYTQLAKETHPDRFVSASDNLRRLAEEVFGEVSKAYEMLADAPSRAAYVHAEQERRENDEALAEGQAALRAEMAFQRGAAALKSRNAQAALEHFDEAVEAFPEEGEYHAFRGWAYYLADPEADGRAIEAIRIVTEGRKLAPDREKPYLFLGRLYQVEGRTEVAEKMLTRAILLEPESVEALRELRLLHMRRAKSKGIVKRILRR